MRSWWIALAWAASAAPACDRGRVRAEAAAPAVIREAASADGLEHEGAPARALDDGAAVKARAARPAPPPIEVTVEPGADLRVVVDVEGWAAVAVAGVVVVLERDFLHLRGFDAITGAERWRLRAQERASGQHSLYVHGERALLHAGGRLIYVDARSGQRLSESPAYHSGGDSGCALVERAGTCSYTCDCRLQLFECATGAMIGGAFNSAETHLYHDLSGEHDTVCWRRPATLGRSGVLDLALIDGAAGSHAIVAVDSRSGEQRWRREDLVPLGVSYVRMGMSEDALTCFVADPEGALVRAFSCVTGATLWEGSLPPREGLHRRLEPRFLGNDLWLAWASDVGTEVEVRAPSGKTRWRRGFAAHELPWPAEGSVGDATRWQAPPYELVFVRSTTGEALGRAPVAEQAAIFADPLGGLVIAGARVEERGRDGALRRDRAAPMTGIHSATTRHFFAGDRESTTALRREDLRPALRIRGQISAIEGSGLAATARLFYGHREAPTPGRILLLDALP
ncbi:MAG: PQQ-binding-like beta-propeller repeat protein [Nannocystis sp.]|nr:PQQ-binding-like beta-propeller repeat protein [Nannocystis sp.]